MSDPIKLVIDYGDSMVVVNAIEGVNEALAKAGISWEFVSDNQPHDGQEVYYLKDKQVIPDSRRLDSIIQGLHFSPEGAKMVRGIFACICSMGYTKTSIFADDSEGVDFEFIEFSTGVGDIRVFPPLGGLDVPSCRIRLDFETAKIRAQIRAQKRAQEG